MFSPTALLKRRRILRSLNLSIDPIGLRRHDEVVFVKALDLMRPPSHVLVARYHKVRLLLRPDRGSEIPSPDQDGLVNLKQADSCVGPIQKIMLQRPFIPVEGSRGGGCTHCARWEEG
jgi:hypothetical protein